MKKRYLICFAAAAVFAAVIIIFFSGRNDRELLLKDLWQGKEISRIAFVEEAKGDLSGTFLSEEEMNSFLNDFGNQRIERIRGNEGITGWTHGVRMYDEKGEQVMFICFLGARISAGEAGTYLCTTSQEELYQKLALYEK